MNDRANASAKGETFRAQVAEPTPAEFSLERRPTSRHRPPDADKHHPQTEQRTDQASGAAGASPLQPVNIRVYVSRPGDPYEHEADRAVEDLLGPLSSQIPNAPRQMPVRLRLPESQGVQPKSSPSNGNSGKSPPKTDTPAFIQRLQALRSRGAPLPADTRRFFKQRFDFDFDSVRVHTGHEAAELTRQAGARAFTSGSDIAFGQNEYAPQTQTGIRLLGHELAHVIQQSGMHNAPFTPVFREAVPGQPDLASQGAAATDAPPVADKLKEELSPGLALPPLKDQERPDALVAKSLDQATPVLKTPDKQAGKNGQLLKGKDAAAGAEAAKEGEEVAPKAEPQAMTDLASGDLALIDAELAEHQRWAGASAMVGAAGSEERGQFVLASALAGEVGGLGAGFVGGLKTGAEIRAAEYAVGKGAALFATKYAAKFGTQAAKFTPLPAVGAVIGGAMSAYELIGRDWSKTGETIGRFGQGAETYEQLANNIAAVSEVLDVATQVMNVIAGVIGVIAIASWAIAIATLGVASPLSATLTSIALGIGIATMIIDGINALVLKQLIVIFRSLHAFTSQADPSEVVVQGKKIGEAAEAASGFLGGLAGAKVAGSAGKGGKPKVPAPETPAPHPDHPMPPTATGEGPLVKAEPPVEGKGVKPPPEAAKSVAEPPEAAKPETAPPTPEAGAVEPKGKGRKGSKKSGAAKTKLTQKERLAELQKLAGKSELTRGDIYRLAEVLDISPEEVKARFARAALEQTVGERTAMAEGRGVEPELGKIPEAPSRPKPEEMRRLKQITGEGSMSKRVEKSIRKTSRESAKRKFQEASVDISEHTALTLQSRENIAEFGLEHLEATEGGTPPEYHRTRGFEFVDESKPGQPPPGFEESHYVPVKQDPAFAHKGAEVSVYEQHGPHFEETHGLNYAAELELLGPRGSKSTGFQHEFSGQSGVIVENRRILENLEERAKGKVRSADIAERRAQGAERKGQTELAQKAREEAQQLRSDAKSLDIQIQKMRETLPVLENLVKSATPEQRRSLGPPSRQKTPATVPAAPGVKPPVQATPEKAPEAKPVPEPLPETTPTPGPKPKAGPEPIGPETRNLGLAARAGAAAGKGGPAAKEEEAEPGVTARGPLTTGEKALYIASGTMLLGPGGGVAAALSLSGFEKARREPVVEHVNPQYPEPPGTLQDHVNVQNQLLDILQARAQAEAAQQVGGREEAKHQANQEPIQKAQEGSKEAISATEAHKQVIARREEANKKSGENEDSAKKSIEDYGSRSAKLVAITGPLRAFERFTYLATYLPDSPDVLVRVKSSILKVHSDAEKFLKALGNVDSSMKQQGAEQPKRAEQIKSDAEKLTQTDQEADKSGQSLDKAQQGTTALQADNEANLQLAAKMKQEAASDGQKLDAQARQKEAQAQSMAAAWQSWAQRHRQARADALEQTKKRMEQLGYQNVEAQGL